MNVQDTILSYIKEATGRNDVISMDYKAVENISKEKFDFKKVRGSVRLIVGKIKTAEDVDAMRKEFLALRIP